MDDAGQEHVGQLHEQAEVLHLQHCCAENLRVARIKLPLEKLQLLHLHAVDLRLGSDALCIRDVLGDIGNGPHVGSTATSLVALCQATVDNEVRIPPDRT